MLRKFPRFTKPAGIRSMLGDRISAVRLSRRKTATAGVFVAIILLFTVRWNGFNLFIWLKETRSEVVITQGSRKDKTIALTFDDGPDVNYTPRVLAILRKYRIHATFFEEGRMIKLHPDLARLTVENGHSIGNHTFSHPYLERESPSDVRAEIAGCDREIASELGIRTTLLRPPRGAWNPTIFEEARRTRRHIILWSVALEHQSTPAPTDMAERVLKQIQPGGIILMHDGGSVSRESTVQALPILIAGLLKRGYRMVSVPELLGIAGVEQSAQFHRVTIR